MEDISRELEREIKSYSKPSKSKRKRDKRLILVDDFGNMKAADWIRRTARLFFYLSIVLGAVAGFYYWLYSDLKAENRELDRRLSSAEERIDKLTSQKEHLMAKVVLSGQSLGDMKEDKKSAAVPEKTGDKAAKAGDKPESGPDDPNAKPEKVANADNRKAGQTNDKKSEQEKGTDINEKVVDIENFRTSNDSGNGDLLVRFKILNVTDEPGDISGHIFILLYPEDGDVTDGLVVPTVPVQDGIPVNPNKGQFFSIAHFKPVKFRVQNTPGSDFFKHAEVVVFNQEDRLVLRKKVRMMGQEQE